MVQAGRQPRRSGLSEQQQFRMGQYRVVLGDGVAIELDDHFQEATLGRLLRVLSPC